MILIKNEHDNTPVSSRPAYTNSPNTAYQIIVNHRALNPHMICGRIGADSRPPFFILQDKILMATMLYTANRHTFFPSMCHVAGVDIKLVGERKVNFTVVFN